MSYKYLYQSISLQQSLFNFQFLSHTFHSKNFAGICPFNFLKKTHSNKMLFSPRSPVSRVWRSCCQRECQQN